jgi:hypothetical protein
MLAQCIGVPSDFMHVNGEALVVFGDGGQAAQPESCAGLACLFSQGSDAPSGFKHVTGGYGGSDSVLLCSGNDVQPAIQVQFVFHQFEAVVARFYSGDRKFRGKKGG